MGCCILAAIIASQFVLFRRRLRALWWPDRDDREMAGASAWRPSAAAFTPVVETGVMARPAHSAARPSLVRCQRAVVVVAAIACGYLLVAHAAHLRDVALGRSGAWQALVNDSWCGTFASRDS
jgi:hypothetical protein